MRITAAGLKVKQKNKMRSLNTIIKPAKKSKAVAVEKQSDGSMKVLFADGSTGVLSAEDKTLQAFVVYTMLNPECTQ